MMDVIRADGIKDSPGSFKAQRAAVMLEELCHFGRFCQLVKRG
jgi:hypothetical protein